MKLFKSLKMMLMVILLLMSFFCGCNISNEGNEADKKDNIEDVKNVEDMVLAVLKKETEKMRFESIKEIIERGYIKIAMVPDDVDVFCRVNKDGDVEGLDAQIAKKLAQTLGVKLEVYKAKQYEDILKLLLNKEADLAIAMYSIDPDRASVINFSDPYLESHLCVTVNSVELVKHNIVQDPIDYLRNNQVKIGVMKGSIHVNTVTQIFPKAQIIEFDSQDKMEEKVMNGEIFAVFQGEIECLCDYIRIPKMEIYTKTFVFSDAKDRFSIALPPDNIEMLNFINAYIKSIKMLTNDDVERECQKLYNN